jgi:hypothetical protein
MLQKSGDPIDSLPEYVLLNVVQFKQTGGLHAKV